MKTYAVSDIHGRYDLFEKLKNMLSPDDVCYVLGDCADRGPDGWKIIKEVYEDPRFIYIKGNHEDMLVQAMKDYIHTSEEDREVFFVYSGNYRLCCHNGGGITFRDWGHDTDHPLSWIKKLDDLPYEKVYLNKQGERVVLTHAGYTPHLNQTLTKEDYLWDRYHFNHVWDMDFVDTIIVHGHTPTPYMDEYLMTTPKEDGYLDGAWWYSEDSNGKFHKVNIDGGAVFTNKLIVLNLDTWNEIMITQED